MNRAPLARAARGAATVARLLDATIAVLRDEGAAAVSIQRVADVAGMSKGLVHYHFADKDALLISCAQRLATQLTRDESVALAHSTVASALDDLWAVFAAPAYQGRRRAYLALANSMTANTKSALLETAKLRQREAAHTISALSNILHFDIPVSAAALSLAFLAVVDGLMLDAAGGVTERHRQAYNAFWLAVLSLTG